MAKIDFFMAKLESELEWRFDQCPPTATALSVMLAVLNAVAEARKKTIEIYEDDSTTSKQEDER